MELTESEWTLYEALHHPAIFMEFVTPVDDRATKVLPMDDWMANDHWGFVRPYQYPTLGWDHMFLDDVDIDSEGQRVDRVSAGTCYDWGGRATSKSFGGTHDELQDGVLRISEDSLITSKDDNHVTKRIELIWKYKETHPLFKVLIKKARQDPYVTIDWWNGHTTYGIPEGTYAQGEAYLGIHVHRVNIDEFQLMSEKGWKNLHDARDKEAGCVVRTTGVSDGRVDTPAHQTRHSARYARYVHIKPQLLNERGWSPHAKRNAIEGYDSEDSQGYKTNVLAEEGEPVQSAWDIDQILACTARVRSTKNLVNRDFAECPVERVQGVEFKRSIEEKMSVYRSEGMAKGRAREKATQEVVAKINLPPVRDLDCEVVLSMDVGQRMSPSIVGIWGLDDKRKPHLWGMLSIFKVDYPDQAEILKYVIQRYDTNSVGLDATGNDGQAIIQMLAQWRSEDEGLLIVPVIFSSTVELPDPTQPVKRGRKAKQAVRKLRVKYYTTCQMRLRFQQQNIGLLHDPATFVEFRTESAKSSDSPVVGEVYSTSTSDHRIDMMRVLEMLLFHMSTKKKKRRMRDPKRVMASVTRY